MTRANFEGIEPAGFKSARGDGAVDRAAGRAQKLAVATSDTVGAPRVVNGAMNS